MNHKVTRCFCVILGQAVSAASHPRGARSVEGGRDCSGSAGSADVKVSTSVHCLTQALMNAAADLPFFPAQTCIAFPGTREPHRGRGPNESLLLPDRKRRKENVSFHDVSMNPVCDHHIFLFVLGIVLLTWNFSCVFAEP